MSRKHQIFAWSDKCVLTECSLHFLLNQFITNAGELFIFQIKVDSQTYIVSSAASLLGNFSIFVFKFMQPDFVMTKVLYSSLSSLNSETDEVAPNIINPKTSSTLKSTGVGSNQLTNFKNNFTGKYAH